MNLLAWLSLAVAVWGTGADPPPLQGTTISGVALVLEGGGPPPEAARRLVEIEAGDRYSAATVRQSIKQLFALGVFSDIKVEAERDADAVALTFRLYPVFRIANVDLAGPGPDLSSTVHEKLRKQIGIRPGEAVDVGRVEDEATRLVETLQQDGFLWAGVEPELLYQGEEAQLRFHVSPGERARVGELVIDGVPAYLGRQIRVDLAFEPGHVYEPARFRQRLDALVDDWKTRGFYLAKIDLEERAVTPPGVRLALTVDIGPRVLIQVEGASLGSRELNRLMTVSREASMSMDLVEESRANLQAYFRDDGYRDAEVEVHQRLVSNGDYLLLTFVVTPGQRFQVGSVILEGVPPYLASAIRSLMKTRPGSMFRSTPFRLTLWEDDVRDVRGYLRELGYHRAEVGQHVTERSDEPGTLDVALVVDVGPRAFLGSIQIEGASQIPSAEVLSASGLVAGEVLAPARIVDARRRITDLYRNRGFRRADVQSRVAVDPSGTEANILFRIEEGLQTFVDRIIVTGLDVTREETIHQEITLRPHTPLSALELFETRQRLIGTGIFSDVNVEVLPTDPVTRSSDVLISVREGPRTTFGYGFGYTERDKARVEGEITRHNLFGRNRTASLFSRVSFGGNRFIATYRQPEMFGLTLPVFVTGFFEEQDRTGFSFNRVGFALQFSKKLSESKTLFFRYRFDRNRTFRLEIPITDLDRRFLNYRIGALSLSQVVDTRDDPISPSSGQFRLLDLEWSAESLGTQSRYLKGLAQQFFYFPLFNRVTGVVGVRVGVGETFPSSDAPAPLPGLQILVDPELLPPTERFFAGGSTTLRGFGLDEASRRDPFGNPIGGNVLSLLNMELRYPITEKLGGVIFSDNGNVYRRVEGIRLLNWRYNVGLGFRYQTPLGPIRVDYGVKVDRRPGEPKGRWHVSLGHPF